MAKRDWNADLEVAVYDEELIIRADHLPPLQDQEIEIEMDGDDVNVYGHSPSEEHYLHLPLPFGLGVETVQARLSRGGIELRMHVPA
jgi:HSP20 family molecular chaperone IbpA